MSCEIDTDIIPTTSEKTESDSTDMLTTSVTTKKGKTLDLV